MKKHFIKVQLASTDGRVFSVLDENDKDPSPLSAEHIAILKLKALLPSKYIGGVCVCDEKVFYNKNFLPEYKMFTLITYEEE